MDMLGRLEPEHLWQVLEPTLPWIHIPSKMAKTFNNRSLSIVSNSVEQLEQTLILFSRTVNGTTT